MKMYEFIYQAGYSIMAASTPWSYNKIRYDGFVINYTKGYFGYDAWHIVTGKQIGRAHV